MINSNENVNWYVNLSPVKQTALMCILLAQKEIIRNGKNIKYKRGISNVIENIAKSFEVNPEDAHKVLSFLNNLK